MFHLEIKKYLEILFSRFRHFFRWKVPTMCLIVVFHSNSFSDCGFTYKTISFSISGCRTCLPRTEGPRGTGQYIFGIHIGPRISSWSIWSGQRKKFSIWVRYPRAIFSTWSWRWTWHSVIIFLFIVILLDHDPLWRLSTMSTYMNSMKFCTFIFISLPADKLNKPEYF